MTTVDISHMSPQERLDLIGKLWDSLESDQVPVTSAQQAELDWRLATLDEDIKGGRDADEVIAELCSRYR